MTQILYNRAVKLFMDKISAGFDEYAAHEIIASKYGIPVADKIFSEAKSLEKQIRGNPRNKRRWFAGLTLTGLDFSNTIEFPTKTAALRYVRGKGRTPGGRIWIVRERKENPRTKSRILQKPDKPTNIKKILKEIDITKNELRFRMQNSNKFDKESFRRKEITKGISIILGCPKENGTSFWDGKCRKAMETQALRFSREHFTKEKAAEWISKHTQLRY